MDDDDLPPGFRGQFDDGQPDPHATGCGAGLPVGTRLVRTRLAALRRESVDVGTARRSGRAGSRRRSARRTRLCTHPAHPPRAPLGTGRRPRVGDVGRREHRRPGGGRRLRAAGRLARDVHRLGRRLGADRHRRRPRPAADHSNAIERVRPVDIPRPPRRWRRRRGCREHRPRRLRHGSRHRRRCRPRCVVPSSRAARGQRHPAARHVRRGVLARMGVHHRRRPGLRDRHRGVHPAVRAGDRRADALRGRPARRRALTRVVGHAGVHGQRHRRPLPSPAHHHRPGDGRRRPHRLRTPPARGPVRARHRALVRHSLPRRCRHRPGIPPSDCRRARQHARRGGRRQGGRSREHGLHHRERVQCGDGRGARQPRDARRRRRRPTPDAGLRRSHPSRRVRRQRASWGIGEDTNTNTNTNTNEMETP